MIYLQTHIRRYFHGQNHGKMVYICILFIYYLVYNNNNDENKMVYLFEHDSCPLGSVN